MRQQRVFCITDLGVSVDALLLDTCAAIWLAANEPFSRRAECALLDAGTQRAICVSSVTAWEVGLLSRRRRAVAAPPSLMPDPKAWFARLVTGPGIRLVPLTADILIDASHLPGRFHADPADRMLVATARHLAIPIVTRDRKIIEYAEQGHVGVIVC